MTIDKIKECVSKSDLPQIQKNVMNAFIDRAKERQDKDSDVVSLIQQVARDERISDVIISTDEVKIYTINGKSDWDIEFPFRIIYLNKKGTWEKLHNASPNLDLAYLIYLQYKHLNANCQFVDFAIKMLEIQNK